MGAHDEPSGDPEMKLPEWSGAIIPEGEGWNPIDIYNSMKSWNPM